MEYLYLGIVTGILQDGEDSVTTRKLLEAGKEQNAARLGSGTLQEADIRDLQRRLG
jgi:hypothetical protein